jgi:hypothetical protein
MMLVSSCIVVTSNVQAGKASDWSAPATLQLAGNYLNASDPVVDMNDGGDAVVAWTTYDSSSGTEVTSVSAAVFSSGSWSSMTAISAPGTNSSAPEIAMNDNGDILVVWVSTNATGYYYLQATSYINGAWGEVLNISSPANDIRQWSIAFNNNGNGSLVWSSSDGSAPRVIMAAIYSEGVWGSEVVISSTLMVNNNPVMALSPVNGDAVAVWEQQYGGENRLAAATCSGGAWSAPGNITSTGDAYYDPSVALTSDGAMMVACENLTGSVSVIEMFQGSFTSGTWRDVHMYSDSLNLYNPEVRMSADGSQLAIAWMVDADPNNYMNATVFTDGSWTPEERISSTFYDAFNLWLDINNAGNVVALWTGLYSTTYYVCASVFDNGAWGGADYITEGSLDMPRVAMGGNGCAIAAWYTMDPVSSEKSIYYSLYVPTPSVTITSPAEDSINNTGSVRIEWTGTNVDYYLVSVNDAQPINVDLATFIELNDLEDGAYSVNVTAYTNAGKTSSAYVNFVVDTAAPDVTITNPMAGAWYNTTTMNVTWTATDLGSGIANMSVSMDGGAFVDVTTSYKEFTSLADGQHTVFVRVYDNSGNFSTVGKAFNIDTELPILNITEPDEDALIDSKDVQLVWTGSSVSAIGRYWISVDLGDFVDVGQNTSRMLTGLGEGAHTVTLKARDYAGNYNTTSVGFTVDSIAPEVSIVSPADGTYSPERNVTVEWTVSESGSGLDSVEISINGGEWISVAENSYALRNLTDGSYTVAIRATDVAGNVGIAFAVFSVDNIAPTATISPSGDNVAISSVIVVEFSEAMNTSSVMITVEGFDSVTGTVSWNGNVATFTPSSALPYNSGYTVNVTGKDLAGNMMNPDGYETFTTMKDECTISGIVKDADGNAVANATVTLSNGVSTTTDVNGYFELTAVPSGSYTLTITKDGFQTVTQTVSTEAGETTDLATLSIAKTASANGDDGSMLWIAGAFVVLVAALLIVGFLLYRRKKDEKK